MVDKWLDTWGCLAITNYPSIIPMIHELFNSHDFDGLATVIP